MQETALPVVLLFGKMNEAALDNGTQWFRWNAAFFSDRGKECRYITVKIV